MRVQMETYNGTFVRTCSNSFRVVVIHQRKVRIISKNTVIHFNQLNIIRIPNKQSMIHHVRNICHKYRVN